MIKWKLFFLIFALISIFSIMYALKYISSPAITFFPLNEERTFLEAESKLHLIAENAKDLYEISWTSDSKTDQPFYLRQDVSLLFENGLLRGVRSKWVQDTDEIHIEENLLQEDSSFYQVISIHHGEIHDDSSEITSIHQLSHDYLYVIDSPATQLDSFKEPGSSYEAEWKQLLDRSSKQQLLFHWHQLFTYFGINEEDYLAVPLTELDKYEEEPLPAMSNKETGKIMGQLWEGLYKNYIIPIVSEDAESMNSYIPIVLFDKNNKHLQVLFELNGEKQQLLQKYDL
ncbi:hypothetical protein [Virgibacillus sp. YIM 98842]|jgi:hypothetical protein|uniref:hypothetical protein n=1 Tax=Virgibacillus sp. YIM 98842 TaxID=2663533 RepID=UPI0013DB661B|nr:hypothetical protein [Virgibacillus sp. YIM 98842]